MVDPAKRNPPLVPRRPRRCNGRARGAAMRVPDRRRAAPVQVSNSQCGTPRACRLRAEVRAKVRAKIRTRIHTKTGAKPCVIARILCGPGQAVVPRLRPPGFGAAGQRPLRGAERRETRDACDRIPGRLGESRPTRLRGASLPFARKRASRRSVRGVFPAYGPRFRRSPRARIVSQLLAAGPIARERSPVAARARGVRNPHARGRRIPPRPHDAS